MQRRARGLPFGKLVIAMFVTAVARAAFAAPVADAGVDAAGLVAGDGSPGPTDVGVASTSDAGAALPALDAGIAAVPDSGAAPQVVGAGNHAPNASPAEGREPAKGSPPPLPAADGAAGPGAHVAAAPAPSPSPPWSFPSLFGLPPLQFHAFVSQGAMLSTRNNYLGDTKKGSFDFSEAAINLTQVLTDRMSLGMQLYSRLLGNTGDFTPMIDWLELDYRFADWLGIRVGRTKIPFGLYNESQETDSARVPVILPQAVYEIENTNLLLAQTGAEVYGYVNMGPAGALEYRLYGGTLYSPPPALPAGFTLTDFDVPYLAGGRLLWETPIEGLRIGPSVQVLRFNTTFTASTGATTAPLTIEDDLPFTLWLASAEYTFQNLMISGEYGRYAADDEVTGEATTRVVNERCYAMASYRVATWLTPGVYYSSLTSNIHALNTPDNYQHDLAVTFRFDVNRFWIVKLEGHYIDGTTDLSTSLNGNVPLANLAKDWFFFLAKTTAYF